MSWRSMRSLAAATGSPVRPNTSQAMASRAMVSVGTAMSRRLRMGVSKGFTRAKICGAFVGRLTGQVTWCGCVATDAEPVQAHVAGGSAGISFGRVMH